MDVPAQVAAARRAVLTIAPTADEGGRPNDRGGSTGGVAGEGGAAFPTVASPSIGGGRTTLVVAGRDRVSWLNGLLTCDLVKRASGDARYGLFVARNGRVLADALVVVAADQVLVSVPSEVAASLVAHLEHYLVMEDAEITQGRLVDLWTLHGPRSSDVLRAGLRAGADGGNLDRTGLGGAILFAGAERRSEVASAILGSTAALGGAVGDASGWSALRIERGVPAFGLDFGETTYPQEAALEKTAVSFDKGCYLGQEVVCMLEMRGHVKRKLVTLVLEGGDPPVPGASVTDDGGASAGEITSAAVAPTLGRPVAIAMVKRALAHPGGAVFVGAVRARVVERVA